MNPLPAGSTAPVEPASGYRRPSRWWRVGALALTAGAVVGVACGGGDKPKDSAITGAQWIETDGAAGRINLDDVQEAYKNSFDKETFQVNKFEEEVNKIFEGDNLVLVKVDKQDNNVLISGWEDLNANKTLDADSDDQLFTIDQTLEDNGKYDVRGHGSNGYYSGGGFFTGFFPGLLLGSLLSGGRTTYITPPGSYDSMSSSRGAYRNSSDYQRQRDRNSSYGSGVNSRFGSNATTRAVSPARSSYQSRQVNSGGFRSSGSTSRSIGSGGRNTGITSGSGGSSGSSGGVTGGGGLMRL